MQQHRSSTVLLAATALALAALTGCAGGSSSGSTGTAAGTPATTPTSTSPTPTPTESESAGPTASPSPTADLGQVVAITVAKGKVTGPKGRVKIEKGSKVTLEVTSDVADEVHLHGYDKSVDVAKGETAKLTFTADVAGVFEVELEERALQLTQFQVQ